MSRSLSFSDVEINILKFPHRPPRPSGWPGVYVLPTSARCELLQTFLIRKLAKLRTRMFRSLCATLNNNAFSSIKVVPRVQHQTTSLHDYTVFTLSLSCRRSCAGGRGGGLGSSTICKNLMSPMPRRKWYLTTGRRAH